MFRRCWWAGGEQGQDYKSLLVQTCSATYMSPAHSQSEPSCEQNAVAAAGHEVGQWSVVGKPGAYPSCVSCVRGPAVMQQSPSSLAACAHGLALARGGACKQCWTLGLDCSKPVRQPLLPRACWDEGLVPSHIALGGALQAGGHAAERSSGRAGAGAQRAAHFPDSCGGAAGG